jgi:phosphoribosylaminoimidazole-succinocarboxamide synthase
MTALFQTSIKSLPLVGRGKVRDLYAVGEDKLLMVATDRLSAFDVVMDQPIPDKGVVLNRMSEFWFAKLAHLVPNHLTGIDPETVVRPTEVEQVRGRAVVARRLKPIPVEAVVRGYLIGSGWREYCETGTVFRKGCSSQAGSSSRSLLPPPRQRWGSMTRTSPLSEWSR